MKIVVENSMWANVGNGWYQFSLYYMLKRMYPQHEIVLGEGPIDTSFRIRNKKQFANALNWMYYQKGDIHIFSGPMMGEVCGTYKNKIIEIKSRGAEYALISASGTGISPERLKIFGEFLQKYPPLFFASRDEETYLNFKPYIKNSYNGICTAFLVDRNINIQKYQMPSPFFISSFYTELEPTYVLKDKSRCCNIGNIELKHHKTMFGLPFRYSRHLNFLREQQKEIGEYNIVRTVQNLNTKFNHINFAMPNSFISFNPLTYLEITKSSAFIISDRVHACAVGLACNKPVRFCFTTPRAGIFSRLGFDYIKNDGIMYPNMEIIDIERTKLEEQILKYI